MKVNSPIPDRVLQIVKNACGFSDIDLTSDLKDEFDLDELDYIEISLELENEFDIVIEEEDVVDLKTVGDIVNLVEEKL